MTARSMFTNGFTLVEVLIAVGIASGIMLIASGIYLQSTGAYYGMQQRSSLSQDALLLVDYLRNQVLPAGGGSVRAWMGIWAEDSCAARSVFPACGGSDRLTVSTAAYPLQECGITSMINPTTLQVAFSSPGVCCMGPPAGGISFANQNVIVALNGNFINRYATVVDLVGCTMTIQPGQASGWDQPAGTVDWSAGTVTLVNVETLYLDTASNTLMRFVDANNNGVIDAGENMAVAIGVIDFQVALGYDFNPEDGRITNLPGGINDEWMYNAFGEGPGLGVFVAPLFTPSSLLLVSPAVIMGVANSANQQSGASTAQILNGPNRSVPGWSLRTEVTQLAPRNSYVFQ